MTTLYSDTYIEGLKDALAAISEQEGGSFNPEVSRYDDKPQTGGKPPHIRLWVSGEDIAPGSELGASLRCVMTITGNVSVYQNPEARIPTDELLGPAKRDVLKAILDYTRALENAPIALDDSFGVTFTPAWELDDREPEEGFQFVISAQYSLQQNTLGILNPY